VNRRYFLVSRVCRIRQPPEGIKGITVLEPDRDTYIKVAFYKLYDRKNALVVADILNDTLIPFLF
jgi:hypothetical protein